jgi:hypothetical protein
VGFGSDTADPSRDFLLAGKNLHTTKAATVAGLEFDRPNPPGDSQISRSEQQAGPNRSSPLGKCFGDFLIRQRIP